MGDKEYIKVLLPVNLDWMPTYSLPSGMKVGKGDRVRVKFARKDYIGVVYGYDDSPQLCKGNIIPIDGLAGVPPVTTEEFELWEFVSRYYLCPLGDVSRVASPACVLGKMPDSTAKKILGAPSSELPKPRLSDVHKQAVREILEAFDCKKNVLLCAGKSREKIYSELSRRCLERGKDVLVLRPVIEKPDNEIPAVYYCSSMSLAQKRNAVFRIRNGGPVLCIGESAAVLLPFVNLGLVIVDDEFSTDYKQTFHPPFFNARDLAFVLARIWNSDLLLCAETPSLESLYNCAALRLHKVSVKEGQDSESASENCEIIDISKEKSKNGMIGNFSRIALSRMTETLQKSGRILLLQPWKDTSDIEIEARKHFSAAMSSINSLPLWMANAKELGKYSLVILLNVDYLLSRQDFRADEYAFRQLERLKKNCRNLLVQTGESSHYIFDNAKALDTMMAQRKDFSLPPFSREVRIKTGSECASHFFPKDSSLESRKKGLLKGLPKGAVIDVDPVGLKF